MTHLMYDNATPIKGGVVGTDTVLVYAGGDTPHVWTASEIVAQPERYRLPCYVRSNAGTNPATDAAAFVIWLKATGCPVGSATVLDLEELVAPVYVTTFGNVLHNSGYKVLPYGSTGFLFKNPALDGYFAASPGAKTFYPDSVATQFLYAGGYDLSWVEDTVPLWDTQPGATPPANIPIGIIKQLEGKVGKLNAPIVDEVVTTTGKGYTQIAADGGTFNFGDAVFLGSLGGKKLNAPIVAGVGTKDDRGLILLGTDGGVFCFGTAKFEGSEGGKPLNAPAVTIRLSPSENGYGITAADGGEFTFGDFVFEGSMA